MSIFSLHSKPRSSRLGSAVSCALIMSLAGCMYGPEDEADLDGELSGSSSALQIDIETCGMPVRALNSIEIVHPNVVNDARASNASNGVWSFRNLIQNMAPIPAGSEQPDTDGFVRTIFESWLTDQVVGSDVAPARPLVDSILLQQFRVPGSNPARYDLARAPFRLLAIANRLDLREEGKNAGEGRFIFGLTQGGAFHPSKRMTLIIEYKLPLSGALNTPEKWAQKWHELDALSMASNPAAFNAKLEEITKLFTARGVNPGGPNGSAVSQIRTNENAFVFIPEPDPNGPPLPEINLFEAQLREFNMNAQGYMVPATTKDSPSQLLNGTAELADFINRNRTALTAPDFLSFHMDRTGNGTSIAFGAKSDMSDNASGALEGRLLREHTWVAPGADPVALRNFSQLTCNGCHQENKVAGLDWFMVNPADVRTGSDGSDRLASFLTSGTEQNGGKSELRRRGEDMADLLCAEGPSDYRRTVVLIQGQTQSGQDMFIRGGLDHAAASSLGRSCTAQNYECAIPVVHRNLRNATTQPWKVGDSFLDWYGRELTQTGAPANNSSYLAVGSAADWTTNVWPSTWGTKRTVAVDGFGEEPLNSYGQHYWMLDVDMDCSKGFQASDGTVWFEVKSFISNGPGWEPDIRQAGAPYLSGNHFAKCGMINVFRRGDASAAFRAF